jgi:hypothetical protein
LLGTHHVRSIWRYCSIRPSPNLSNYESSLAAPYSRVRLDRLAGKHVSHVQYSHTPTTRLSPARYRASLSIISTASLPPRLQVSHDVRLSLKELKSLISGVKTNKSLSLTTNLHVIPFGVGVGDFIAVGKLIGQITIELQVVSSINIYHGSLVKSSYFSEQ